MVKAKAETKAKETKQVAKVEKKEKIKEAKD